MIWNTSPDRVATRLMTTLLMTALLAAGCVGQASPAPGSDTVEAPSSGPITSRASQAAQAPSATVRPTASPLPADLGCSAIHAAKPSHGPDPTPPPAPSPVIAGSDAGSVAAIAGAVDALATLRSYRMSVDVVGVDLVGLQPDSIDWGVRGTVTHTDGFAMDALFGIRMREFDNSAATSISARYVVGDGYAWGTDNISGVLEPSSIGPVTSSIVVMAPEGLADRVISPFAGGFRRVGVETHGGVETVHYRTEKPGAEAYAAAFHYPGAVTADLWIAATGGELVGARIAGTSSHPNPSSGATVDDSLLVAFEVTDPDDAANVVTLPARPVADPVRPTGPPVDLKLEYQVVPANGAGPTPADLDAIGAALRTRLDMWDRPVTVDIVGQDRVLVTVCGTTRPEVDRRLIVAPGALTVVPLPAAEYGTATKAGGRALPAVGGSIDPALEPVAPAARLGLTSVHVDPVTGRRGLAFRLSNKSSDAFGVYAAAHPGEYVAIVLDGVVLATLPIEGITAQGNFVFTGDYTEAETHLLASSLYRDPIPFELRPTSDVETPTR